MANKQGQRGRRRGPILVFAGLGLALVLVFGAALTVDVLAFDRTRGGSPPDYQDVRGTPIDWDSFERTESGFVSRGYVLDAHLDCTTGMLSYEVFGIKREYRQLSERALHVHQPREACLRHGFAPTF